MKIFYVLAVVCLSGCVSIDVPGLVTDTAKVTKDAYKSITETKAEAAAASHHYIAHSYVGKETQAVAEIKQTCVTEASQKLNQMAGKVVAYSVIETDIITLNNIVAANCKLAIEK
jgi:hypothetical protein